MSNTGEYFLPSGNYFLHPGIIRSAERPGAVFLLDDRQGWVHYCDVNAEGPVEIEESTRSMPTREFKRMYTEV